MSELGKLLRNILFQFTTDQLCKLFACPFFQVSFKTTQKWSAICCSDSRGAEFEKSD